MVSGLLNHLQGKALRFPEIVPFRLTRDIVDGMGIAGTSGVFRRTCEETLSVLREQADRLLTICEVFLHDPLYRWSLSPLKAARMQRTEENEDSKTSVIRNNDSHFLCW